MKDYEQIIKDLTLEIPSLNPYEEGKDASYGGWEEGARKIVSILQDRLRDSTPEITEHEGKLAQEANE